MVLAMKTLLKKIKRFWRDEEGASGIEYAIVAAMVAVALAFFVTPISTAVTETFTSICNSIADGGCEPPAE